MSLRLAGDRAQFGQADAVDLARLIVGINAVVRRTASVLAGRRPGQRGRLPRQIADAVRLRLCGVSEGSLVVELELPDDLVRSDEMVLDDVSLGEASVLTALAVLDGSATGFGDTATAWTQLADRLDIGGRNDSLTLSVPSHARSPVLLDRNNRTRLDEVTRSAQRDDEAGDRVGVLYEADFERNAARLRTAQGEAVAVKFGDDQAATVKEALRERTRFRGQITYHQQTSEVVAVDVIEILRAQQLVLGKQVRDFWTTKSVTELADEQGVAPVTDIEELGIENVSESETEAFMEALGL